MHNLARDSGAGPGSPTGAHRAPVRSLRSAELAKNALTCTDDTPKEDLAL
jgi:hypothetical protein